MKSFPSHTRSLRIVTCAFAASCAAALFGQTSTHADDSTNSSATASDTTSTDSTSTTSNGETKLKHADRAFVEKAAESGHEEVAISQIAVQRASNSEVKNFAQMMVDDHSRANEELASIATARGLQLKHRAKHTDKWSKKDANDFDRDYVKKMIDDHKKAIDLFSKESKDGSDTELVEFARKTLPTLQHHLDEATKLKPMVK